MLPICVRTERVWPKLPSIQGIRANLVNIVSLCVATKEAVSLLCSNSNNQLRIVIKFITKKKHLHENANAFSERILT